MSISLFKGLIFCVFLAACGFQPMYRTQGQDPAVSFLTASIKIEPVGDEAGRILGSVLQNKLNPDNLSIEKKYKLVVRLSQYVNQDQGIRQDNTASRATMTVVADYTVTDIKTGIILIQRRTQNMSSYNILSEPYATVMAEQTTQKRLIKIVGEAISLQIGAYLKGYDENKIL